MYFIYNLLCLRASAWAVGAQYRNIKDGYMDIKDILYIKLAPSQGECMGSGSPIACSPTKLRDKTVDMRVRGIIIIISSSSSSITININIV